MIYTIVTIYLLIVNCVAFCQMYADKARAMARRRRVRESVLFFTAIIGGSLGACVGMLFFRHKTRKGRFVVWMPVILAVQVLGAGWLMRLV